MYKIQSIIFKKSIWSINECINWLINNNKKYKKIDETKNFYRFRQINPETLIKQGYTIPRTKKLNDGIELIIYYNDNIVGGSLSLSDAVKSIYDVATYNPTIQIKKGIQAVSDVYFKGRQNLVPSAQKLVDKYGNFPIEEIILSRHPISNVMNVVNYLTGDDLKKRLQNTPYDTLYHLQMFVKVNNEWLSIEKEANIHITLKNPYSIKNAERLNVFSNGLTINDLLNNTLNRIGTNNFFNYSAYNLNCQHFILDILISNNLDTPQNTKFVKQDTETIFTENYRKTADIITNAGAVFDTFKEGGRIKRKKKILYSII